MIKPILFNTEMVKAILEGRKTVTRRVVKPQPDCEGVPHELAVRPGFWMTWVGDLDQMPYLPGDILWVRETWARYHEYFLYRAGSRDTGFLLGQRGVSAKWKPSIHMPKEAARVFLRVTGVRVERLQDITEEQAQNEGCNGTFCGSGEALGCGWDVTPQDEFAELWDSTIKPADRETYGWNANPWVWVIEFERCEKPEGWAV